MVRLLVNDLETWVQFFALPQTSCVNLGMSLRLSVPQPPLCKTGTTVMSYFTGYFAAILKTVRCSDSTGPGAIRRI